MANRYWVGGAGNWNDAAHWSATSGGTGGASVPTAADNVTFDANSGTGTVTVNAVANVLDLTFTNIGAITLNNAAFNFNVYGSLTLHSNLTVNFTATGYLYMKATDSRTITINGCIPKFNKLEFDGIGGTWTNQDNMICADATNIYPYNGAWNTNDKLIEAYQIRFKGNFTINASNSIIKISQFWRDGGVPLFNKGTSTIIFKGVNAVGITTEFYNVEFTGEGSNNICNNFTASNELKFSGTNSTSKRLIVGSNTIGTARTITCNGTVTASNVDFRDITLAGTCNKDLSAIPGGSGDCGGNSGIIFTPAQKQYFKHTSGAVNFSDTTKWFSDFSPRTTVGRVPLPQDDWDMDASSFTGTSTITVNCPRIGKSHNLSNVDQSISILLVNNIEVYGSLIWGNNVSVSGGAFIYLFGRTNYDINTYNKPIPSILLIEGDSCFYTLKSNLTVFGSLRQSRGTIDFNDYDCSAYWYWLNTCYLGNGTITELYGGGSYGFDFQGTVYAENSTIKLSPTGSGDTPFIGKSKSFNKVQFSGAHTGNFYITGNNTISEIIIDPGRKVRFTNGTTQNIGKLTAIGTPAAPITIGSTTAGQRHMLNYTGNEASTVEYCNISDSNVTEARRLLAKNSVNAGNNQNWGFDTLPSLALNKKQVDKMYVGDKLVTAIYKGTNKIY